MAMNDLGHVGGFSRSADGSGRAFIFADGKLTDIGTLPGDSFSRVEAINNAGYAVGVSSNKYEFDRGILNKRSFIYFKGVIMNSSNAASSNVAVGITATALFLPTA